MPNLFYNKPDKEDYIHYIDSNKRATIYDKENKCYRLTDEGKELTFDELIQYLGQREDTIQYAQIKTLNDAIRFHDGWR